jgi:dinuclear metal center YbgI/SA1388 family protein
MPMKIDEFIAVMEGFAPSSLAMEYDNVGLLIGTKRQEIQNVLVALDCTEKVAEEAAATGVDLVLTHHPVFFKGIKRILLDDPETAAAYTLIQNGIALYAAQTNLDAASGGVNDVLAEKLGLTNIRPLPPENLGKPAAFLVHDMISDRGLYNDISLLHFTVLQIKNRLV